MLGFDTQQYVNLSGKKFSALDERTTYNLGHTTGKLLILLLNLCQKVGFGGLEWRIVEKVSTIVCRKT